MKLDTAFFDTDVLIHFSHAHPGAQEIMRRVEHRLISIVTWAEFLTGIPEPQMDQAKAFLDDTFEIIETARHTYERALDLRKAHRLKLPDALIYAGAKDMDVPLITGNIKDFNPDWKDIYNPY